jgi:hypothetical protein
LDAQMLTIAGVDVADVVVTTLPGSTISGHVTFEGSDPPRPGDIELVVAPADPDLTPFVGTPPAADIREDGTFAISDVSGPGRLRVARAPKGWTLTRVIVGAIDSIDAVLVFGTERESLTDVEVVLTHEPARVRQ